MESNKTTAKEYKPPFRVREVKIKVGLGKLFRFLKRVLKGNRILIAIIVISIPYLCSCSTARHPQRHKASYYSKRQPSKSRSDFKFPKGCRQNKRNYGSYKH